MVIGAVTAWPIVYLCLFVGFIVYSFGFAAPPAEGDSGIPAPFKYLFVLHLLTMLLMFVLMVIYIVHAFRTDLVPQDKKILWVVVLFFGSFLAMPIYWYLYMWRPLEQNPGIRA